MRPFRVVVKPPFFCQFAYLFDIPEYVRIQYRPAIAAIEAFYIAVLRRLAWLDELVLVGPDALRLPVDEDDLSSIDMTLSAGIDIDISYAKATPGSNESGVFD